MDAWIVYAWQCGEWAIVESFLLSGCLADWCIDALQLAGVPAFAVRQVVGPA